MIFISTTCFDFSFLEDTAVPVENGITNIELSGGGRFYDDEFLQEKLQAFLGNPDCHIRVHNYFPIPQESFIMNFSSADEQQIQQSLALVEKATGLCRQFGVPYYSFHPGYLAQAGMANNKGHFDFEHRSFIDYDTALENFYNNFKKVRNVADQAGIKLAVENLFPRFGKIDSLNNNFAEFDAILQTLPSDTGILLDLGHLNVSATAIKFDRFGYLQQMIDKYGDRIFEIHVSGNDGSDDQHLPLTEDDWQLEALELLKPLPGATGQGVDFTLEARKLSMNELVKMHILLSQFQNSG